MVGAQLHLKDWMLYSYRDKLSGQLNSISVIMVFIDIGFKKLKVQFSCIEELNIHDSKVQTF